MLGQGHDHKENDVNIAKSLLCILLVFGLLGSLPTQAQKSDPIGKLPAFTKAKVVAIKGNSVTIQNDSGTQRTLEMESTKGLKIGLQTAWCEEDCRVLNVLTEYPVRRANPVRP